MNASILFLLLHELKKGRQTIDGQIYLNLDKAFGGRHGTFGYLKALSITGEVYVLFLGSYITIEG